MLIRKKKNNKPVTFEVLNKVLKKALTAQSKTILKAVDFGFKNIKGEITGIKGEITGIKGEITGIKGEMKGMKGDIKDLKQTTRKILNQQDRFVKRLTDLEDENTVSTELYKKHDEKIEEHDERILALEIKS